MWLTQAAETLAKVPGRLTVVEGGVALGVALILVDRIVGWVIKLKGKPVNGEKKTVEMFSKIETSMDAFHKDVEKAHEKQCLTLDNQTLVLDRIYQAQGLQIKALEKLNDKMDERS